MFEQELELERKEGSSFGPVLIILLLVGLFIGGLGVVIYQGYQKPKPQDAAAAAQTRLKNLGSVTLTFHTGNLNYSASDNPNDPQYKLLERAGILKIKKSSPTVANVELTPAGKDFLASFPEVKGVKGKNDTIGYTIPLATRKLASVGNAVRMGQEIFEVQYSWAWEPTRAGDIFDVAGKYVQSLPMYERSILIDQHGAKYYHAAPTQASLTLFKGDHGWELAPR